MTAPDSTSKSWRRAWAGLSILGFLTLPAHLQWMSMVVDPVHWYDRAIGALLAIPSLFPALLARLASFALGLTGGGMTGLGFLFILAQWILFYGIGVRRFRLQNSERAFLAPLLVVAALNLFTGAVLRFFWPFLFPGN